MVYWGKDSDGRGEIFSVGGYKKEEEWRGNEPGSVEFVKRGGRKRCDGWVKCRRVGVICYEKERIQ